MPIPGNLTFELFNKETQVITLEAAVDVDSKPPVVILKDAPEITLPFGGTLTIFGRTDYAIARSISEEAQTRILAGEKHGLGIYDDIITDSSIPTYLAAKAVANSNVKVKCVFAGGWSYKTQNRKLKKGMIQFFQDELLVLTYVGIIQGLSKDFVSAGKVDIDVSVDLYRVTIEETIEELFAFKNRPSVAPKLRLEPSNE